MMESTYHGVSKQTCHTLIASVAIEKKNDHIDLQRNKTTAASDLTDALSKKPIQFRGAFNFTSKYRGPPSPEIDEAWARYDFNREHTSLFFSLPSFLSVFSG